MTLIELTVVILILLGLIAVLAIGSQAYIRSSNRSKCIVNLRAGHQAGRSYQNLLALTPGTAYDPSDFIGEGQFLDSAPSCPSSGSYNWATTVPDYGTAFITCTLAGDPDHNHNPGTSLDW